MVFISICKSNVTSLCSILYLHVCNVSFNIFYLFLSSPFFTVPPQVSLFQKDSSPKVVCHATGFYPDGVMITWKKNGLEIQEDVDVRETLPNEDGTFQKRAVLTVSTGDWKESKFTCEVTHKSGTTVRTADPDELQPGGDKDKF